MRSATSLVLALALALVACRQTPRQQRTLHFTLAQDAVVSLHILDAKGDVVRELARAAPFPKGAHNIVWDGKAGDGAPLASGTYHWAGVVHRGVGLRLRGWACHSGDAPWETDDFRRGWAGEVGVPTSVCADAERVYLGWSAADSAHAHGRCVLACDPDGHVLWSAALPPSTGCEALAVDAGTVAVLVRKSDGTDSILRLNAADGHEAPWPGGPTLTIASLWPAGSTGKPLKTDGIAMRSGRLYLAFTEAQFLAVLDAKTGEYIQTVVGAPPELLDAVPTKTVLPDLPGNLSDADFAVLSLRNGALAKVLFAHDPFWVVMSDLQPLERNEHVTAMTLTGDGAPHHPHSMFLGLDAPFFQVQRREILSSEGFAWTAGREGGRPEQGQWEPAALGQIAGVAIDARGQLWVAERDAVPPRFSVWDTEGTEGRLVHEFFGPVPADVSAHGAAILPGDPNILVGAGCEWRIDPVTGQAACLGIVDREPMARATFRPASGGTVELEIEHLHSPASVFQRRGAGDYALVRSGDPAVKQAHETGGKAKLPGNRGTIKLIENAGVWSVQLEGFGEIASLFESVPDKIIWPDRAAPGADMAHAKSPVRCTLMQTADGRVFLACAESALWELEVTGLENIEPLPGGNLVFEQGK